MNYKKIIKSLENQLKDYLGNKKAVVGVSGGIDSAVVLTLCVKALGRKKVLGVLMPYGNQNMQDAKELMKFLKISCKEINIKEVVDKFDFLSFDKISKGNIMARVRMIILYCFSNQIKGRVIGTGNKSEIEVGYFTKYGDGGVDLEPIGDLYKTDIYEIAKRLGISKKIIDKKPSAELWEGQTDEEDLGLSYEQLDKILKKKLNHEKVQVLRKNSEHKRKTPPIFKVDQ